MCLNEKGLSVAAGFIRIEFTSEIDLISIDDLKMIVENKCQPDF